MNGRQTAIASSPTKMILERTLPGLAGLTFPMCAKIFHSNARSLRSAITAIQPLQEMRWPSSSLPKPTALSLKGSRCISQAKITIGYIARFARLPGDTFPVLERARGVASSRFSTITPDDLALAAVSAPGVSRPSAVNSSGRRRVSNRGLFGEWRGQRA
jgi:hypothetical protein